MFHELNSTERVSICEIKMCSHTVWSTLPPVRLHAVKIVLSFGREVVIDIKSSSNLAWIHRRLFSRQRGPMTTRSLDVTNDRDESTGILASSRNSEMHIMRRGVYQQSGNVTVSRLCLSTASCIRSC